MNLNLNIILGQWVPLGFGIVGIIIVLAGLLGAISGKDNAFSQIFTGIFVVLVAIALRYVLNAFVLDAIGL